MKKPRAVGVALSRRIARHGVLYLFLAPTILYLVIFSYIPMYGIIVAFKDFNPALGYLGSRWVGLKHFRDFLGGYYLCPILRNTILISTYSLAASFPITIGVALLLNEIQSARYKKFVQTVLYAPHFISTVILVGILVIVLSPTSGLFNFVRSALGMESLYFMTSPSAFKHIYVWSGIWQSVGWSAIIYLAALSGVNPELHEAASIDGANRIQRILHINLPTIRPTIVILLILNIGSLIGVGYEKAFLLQNNLNLEQSEVISTYVYRRGLISANYSFGTAVGLLNTVVNILLLLAANTLARRIGDTSLF